MKQLPLILTIGFFLLIAGGYYLYDQVLQKEPLKPWDLVPSETIFVYEKDVCASCIDEMRKTALWQIVSRASFQSRPADSLKAKLNSLIGESESLLISAHITGKDDYDFVYYLTDTDDLLNPGSILPTLKSYRYSERELSGVKIHELAHQKTTFSWIVIGDVWAGSFTPFLIEDVIRTYRGKPGFNKVNPEIRKLPRIDGDAGNMYVQLKNFSDWLSVFVPGLDQSFAVGKSALLDIKSRENNLVLNGFSLDSAAYSDYLLSIFRNQSPVSFSMKNYVPNRAVTFTSFGINDNAAFAHALERFVSDHRPRLRDSLNRIATGLSFEWNDLYHQISDEVGVCLVEGMDGQRQSKILMIETKDADLWIKNLNAVSERFSEDTVFYEKFSHYTIRELPVRKFPEKLFWPLVQGFEHTFYTAYDNMVFMGDNLEELKFFLDDIAHEDIWGKSVSKNQFLETTLLESNVSVFINTPKIWNVLLPRLHPRWKTFIHENHSLLQSVRMSAFQFSHLNNTYYTNISLHHGPERSEVTFASSGRRNVVHFSQPIHRLHAVKSHVSQSNEILIQDSLNDISLVSMEGKVLWKIPVGDQITSDVQQIDFYNNGKLQYIFSTHDAIHIIDRLGNYVPSYPIHLNGKDIQHLTVVDYDRSKRYRFLVSEFNGDLWMYDKTGKNLEGWTPRSTGEALMAPPRHHRIRGKDFIIAIRTDGLVHLYNRRGEMMKNFPLDLQGTPMGDYFLEMGRDIAQSYFVVITRDGFRVRFNAEGQVQNRETLLRAYVGSQFRLIPEKSNKSYLIAQHDMRQLTLSDANGKKILVNDHVNPLVGDVKYYQYGGGKSFITLTDRVQAFSLVFDRNGTMLTSPPLESTAIDLRMANSGQSYVFFIHGETLTIQPLNP